MWAQFFAVVCSPRPKRGRQNAPGAAIALRARGCLGLALLCVLGRFKPNWPLSHARKAQTAISLIAKSTSTAAPHGNPGQRTRLDQAHPGQVLATSTRSSTKTAGSSTALATSAGQCIELDRAHGGTHPANGWPAARQQQHGPSSPATPGCAQPWPPAPGSGSSARRHAPGQGLATRTRQARSSLAGQGVALGWRCFACCSV